MLKTLALTATLLGTVATLAPAAQADVFVNGYTRGNGTYVAPHYRSDPDGYAGNNWSTRGNVNPYTGAPGTRYEPSPTYGSPLRQPRTCLGC